MKLKQLFTVLLFALSTMVSFTAQAWSPLDEIEAGIEKFRFCYLVTADSEGGDEAANAEEEEEPDCD